MYIQVYTYIFEFGETIVLRMHVEIESDNEEGGIFHAIQMYGIMHLIR